IFAQKSGSLSSGHAGRSAELKTAGSRVGLLAARARAGVSIVLRKPRRFTICPPQLLQAHLHPDLLRLRHALANSCQGGPATCPVRSVIAGQHSTLRTLLQFLAVVVFVPASTSLTVRENAPRGRYTRRVAPDQKSLYSGCRWTYGRALAVL